MTTTLHGLAIVVTDEPIGSYLTEDAAIAATTLYLEDAAAFLEAGGNLSLDDGEGTNETVAYTAVDYDTGAITCAALAGAWTAGDSVLLAPSQTQRFVTVEPDDSGLGVVLARVPFTMQPMLPEGIRDDDDREEVVLKIERGQWVVSDVLRTTPTVDGAYVQLVADQVTAEHIAAGTITADKLATELLISSTLKTAEDGQRVEIDQDGLRLISDSDNVLVNLPTEDGADAVFEGEIVATELTVQDATLRGDSVMDVGSTLTLASAQTPPGTAPILTQSVSSSAFDTGRTSVNYPRSLWYWADENDFTYLNGTTGGAAQYWRRVDASGTSVDVVTLDLPADFYVHSLVYHEELDCWVGTGRKEASNDWFIMTWDDDNGAPGNYSDRWDLTTHSTAYPILHKDNGSGTFYVAYGTASGTLIVNTYTWSAQNSPPGITAQVFDTAPVDDVTLGLVAFWRGTADFGATRFVFRSRVTGNGVASFYRVFSTAMAEVSTQDWEGEGSNWGLAYDTANGLFREVSRSEETWLTYSTFTETADNQYQLAYTWFDTTGTEHETVLSPRAEIEHKSRRYLTVSWPSIPTGGADDPDSVRVYMIDNDTDQGDTFGNYKLQGEVAAPAQSTTLTAYSTSTAGSKGTDFATGTPAYVMAGTTPYTDGIHGGGDGFIPIGSVTMWAGPYDEMPPGWLLCNGQAVSRTTYDKLHAILKDVGGTDSYAWGNGDASTTFNLPNFEAKMPLGVTDTSPASAATSTGGSHSTAGGHNHDNHSAAIADHTTANRTTTGSSTVVQASHSGLHNNEGGHTHDSHAYTLLPYLGIVFIIKADHT